MAATAVLHRTTARAVSRPVQIFVLALGQLVPVSVGGHPYPQDHQPPTAQERAVPETPTGLDDFCFLTELIRQIDDDPAGHHNARGVAAALGNPSADTEPNVRCLKNRGLIDWAPGPKRLADGWNADLAVTPEGYRFDGTGLNT